MRVHQSTYILYYTLYSLHISIYLYIQLCIHLPIYLSIIFISINSIHCINVLHSEAEREIELVK